MAVEIRSDVAYQATNLDLSDRPPLPNGALGLADYQAGGSITPTDTGFGPLNVLILTGSMSFRPRFYYGKNGFAFGNGAARISYDAEGLPLGIRVYGSQTQRLTVGQRTNLAAGSLIGCTVLADGAAENPWQQWFAVTPSGEGEASVTLTGSSLSTAGFSWFSIEAAGTGIVQIGGRGLDADDYANFDLSRGLIRAGDGALAHMVERPSGGWSLYVRMTATVASADIAPYVASVADIDTGKLGPSGRPFRARAQSLVTGTSNYGGRTPAMPWGDPNDNQQSDSPAPALFADGANFSAVLTLLSDPWPYRTDAGMFTLVSGGNGIHVVQRPDGYFALARQNGTVLHQFGVRWEPDTLYSLGVTREGTALTVVLNDEVATITDAVVATYAPRFARGIDQNLHEWGGYLQRMIVWNPVSPTELRQLVRKWG